MPDLHTVADRLYWSYANLAMAHSAVSNGAKTFGRLQFIIRARLFKGLRTGTMLLGSFADDERLKMILPQACCYCGSAEKLSVDHVIPRKMHGADTGDNLVWACRLCNSSKGSKDLLTWYGDRGIEYPPILLMRRYLKLVIVWCEKNGKSSLPLEPLPTDLPFALDLVPSKPPAVSELVLWTAPLPVPLLPALQPSRAEEEATDRV